jgi:hypothetical protein
MMIDIGSRIMYISSIFQIKIVVKLNARWCNFQEEFQA